MEAITSFQGTYRFLSNFYILQIPVIFEGLEFFTTEAAYVASKTVDLSLRKEIQRMSPGKAKRFGARIFEEELSPNPVWSDTYKLFVMEDLVFQKFSKDSDLGILLTETYPRKLIEGNTWHDNFFGICSCGNCPTEKTRPPEEQNNLGKISMHVRERI